MSVRMTNRLVLPDRVLEYDRLLVSFAFSFGFDAVVADL
jgi:hypothetical protein